MDKETEITINRLLADNKAAHDLNDYLTKENKRLREVRDMLQAINGAKDKEIAILRAEKHLTALKEGK